MLIEVQFQLSFILLVLKCLIFVLQNYVIAFKTELNITDIRKIMEPTFLKVLNLNFIHNYYIPLDISHE